MKKFIVLLFVLVGVVIAVAEAKADSIDNLVRTLRQQADQSDSMANTLDAQGKRVDAARWRQRALQQRQQADNMESTVRSGEDLTSTIKNSGRNDVDDDDDCIDRFYRAVGVCMDSMGIPRKGGDQGPCIKRLRPSFGCVDRL